MGWGLGTPVGCPDGAPVGCGVGNPVGCNVGTPVGCSVGSAVGCIVGAPDGCGVGTPVGTGVGTLVGWLVGRQLYELGCTRQHGVPRFVLSVTSQPLTIWVSRSLTLYLGERSRGCVMGRV